MAKKGGGAATANRPKDPHKSDDLVLDVKEGLVESSEPLEATAPVAEDVGRIFTDEQAATVGGAIKMFPIARLFRHGNVRTGATEQIPQMVASLKRHGYKRNHPIVVSLKGKPVDKNGHDGLVLCGNRRVLGIEFLSMNEPEEFARLFPDGLIPAIIHEGLTEEQESLIRIDHGTDEDRVPLDEWGEFLAVKQLVRAGYNSQAGIAEKLGKAQLNKKTGSVEPKRSWVQPRVNLARLPQFVQEEMQKYCEESGSSNMRWADIAGLFKVFNDEFMEYPNGDGPKFGEAWEKIVGRDATTGKAKETENLTGAKATEIAKSLSSRTLRAAVVALVKPGRPGLTDLDGAMVKAETAEAVLAEIEEYMGREKFQELVDNAQQYAAEKAEKAPAAVAAATK